MLRNPSKIALVWRHSLIRLGCTALAVGLLAGSELHGEETKPAENAPAPNYEDDVRPILREHCFSCHNQSNAKSDLALDQYASLMAGGASGEVVFEGDLESSRLWMLVSHEEEPRMPPEQDRLPDAKLDVLRRWILGGALEKAGSKVKKPSKPKVDLSFSVDGNQAAGAAIMPVGLSRQPYVYTTSTTAVTALTTSPGAPLAAIGGQRQILLYHTETGELLGVLPFDEGVPHILRFSRNGALLLAGGGRGGHTGKVAVYDVRSGERLFDVGDELDVVLAADINEDHTRIALGGPGRVVRIFDTETGEMLHEIGKHTEWIYALEFSPDGVLLATADRNGDVFVWEAETAREYQNLKGHTAAVNALSWRLDSNLLATTGEDGTIRLWEMEGGKQVKNWNAHGGGSAMVRFAHDGRLVSAGRDRVVKLWDQNGKEERAFEAFGDLALAAAITHDGARVLGGDWQGEVRVWNAADGQLAAHLPTNPLTLQMIAEKAAAEAASTQAEAERLAAELATMESQLAETKAKAGSTTVAAAESETSLATAQADTERATAAAQAAAETLAALEQALAKAQAAHTEADKLAGEKQKLVATATSRLESIRQMLDELTAAQEQIEQSLNESRQAAEAAAQRAQAARDASIRAASEAQQAEPIATADVSN